MASGVDLSVLTPSLNYGHFIEDSLMSVARQHTLAIQHVVQDAGSTDETPAMLARFKDIDWLSEPDRGQSDALNRARARAHGDGVGGLNADEFYLPGALAPLIGAGERSGADVVYGESVIVDESGSLVRLLGGHRFSAKVLTEYGCYISSCSTVFRRSALGGTPWTEGVRKIMDWDLYMALLTRGARFLFVSHAVGAFRLHPDQVTALPREHFEEENADVRARYGRPRDAGERRRTWRRGRRLHRLYKVMDGAYARERRARTMRGRDLRWFQEGVGERAIDDLLRACYGERASRRGHSNP